MQDFKSMRAWQRAHALAIAIHKSSAGFSRLGFSSLRSQLVRSAHSIAANIVEGCAAASKRDFSRFLDISIKSASETEYHLLAARDFRLIPPHEWQHLNAEVIEIRKMIHGYRKRVLESEREVHGLPALPAAPAAPPSRGRDRDGTGPDQI